MRDLYFLILIIIASILVSAAVFGPVPAHPAEIRLAWDAPAGDVTGYRVYVGETPATLTRTAEIGAQTSTTLTLDVIGMRYFAVSAFNEIGESPLSNIVSHDFQQPPVQFENWVDTLGLTPTPGLFGERSVDGTVCLGTDSAQTNIYSHATDVVLRLPFELTGRMRITDAGGGIGVTFLSKYPSMDAYYRLRRYNQSGFTAFHLDPHGTTITGGNVNSTVSPDPNVWQRFRISVTDTGSRTEIKARVWAEGKNEPQVWQIDAWDDGPGRLTGGTIGVWAMGPGSKYWDDLTVIYPTAPDAPTALKLEITYDPETRRYEVKIINP